MTELNPNARIFIPEKEQGPTEGDSYFAMIGDAVARHVAKLTSLERELWEQCVVTQDGNIFRTVPSVGFLDPDPLCLRGKDLEAYKQKIREQTGLPDKELMHVWEDFEREAARREKSEDVLDHCELIPFDQDEQYPGMEKHLDLPETPRDRYIYLEIASSLSTMSSLRVTQILVLLTKFYTAR